jgi:hypothetical protein
MISMEQLRDCSGISEILDRWSQLIMGEVATLVCRAAVAVVAVNVARSACEHVSSSSHLLTGS